MKRLLIITLAFASILACKADKFMDYVNANDYTNAIQCLYIQQLHNNRNALSMTQLSNLFNVAKQDSATHNKACYIACLAYDKGDKGMLLDNLDTLAPHLGKYSSIFKYLGSEKYASTNIIYRQRPVSVNVLSFVCPELALKVYANLFAAGNKDAAASIYQNSQYFYRSNFELSETYINMINSNYAPEDVANFTHDGNIVHALNFYNENKVDRTLVARACSIEAMKHIATNTVSFDSAVTSAYFPCKEKHLDFLNCCLEYGSLKKRILAAKNLDGINKTKAASTQISNYVYENADFTTLADFAQYLGDRDFLLNVWLNKLDDNASATTILNVIPFFASIDAEYRTKDLKKILLNINKKYTLKLYDDRDTWEPVLSKVRALLDTL